tara:strand:+ start:951 stop:2264 length:1314 start_codon:yes stop_codon:yes gene_type:complete
MTRHVITLPLAGKNAVAQAALPRQEASPDDVPIMHYVCFVEPSINNGLELIPKGPNPRYVNIDGKIPKEIEKSFIEDENFAIKNRGLQIIIDDGSFDVVTIDGTPHVKFSCSEPGMTGHYDGQHTGDRVTTAVKQLGEQGHKQHLPVQLVERAAFRTLKEMRDAAKAINNVQKQKNISEFDIAGGFDELKNNLSYCAQENIGWAQNQISTAGTRVTSECQATQVTCLLGSLLPKTFRSGASLSDISSWPKKGEAVINKFNEKGVGQLLYRAATEIDTLLELSDYIQSTLKSTLGGQYETYGILRASTAAQLKKSVEDRKAYKSSLFKTGGSNDHTLNKDIMPVVCYSIVNSVYEYDDQSGFTTNYSIDEMKAIWKEAGPAVLSSIENRYRNSFQTNYKSRWADFALDITMWAQCADLVQRVIYNPQSWKRHLSQKVA